MANRTCSIDRCDQSVKTRGWCNKHYKRWMAHGDPIVTVIAPKGTRAAFVRAVLEGTTPREPNGCILWPYAVDTTGGYPGQIAWEGGTHRKVVHLVLEHFAGPRPSANHEAGHAPHDVCGNRRCLAPEHLSWVTRSENVLQAYRVDKTKQPVRVTGERHPSATVPDVGVREAVARVRAGETQWAVAADFGVSQATISRWVTGFRREQQADDDE